MRTMLRHLTIRTLRVSAGAVLGLGAALSLEAFGDSLVEAKASSGTS